MPPSIEFVAANRWKGLRQVQAAVRRQATKENVAKFRAGNVATGRKILHEKTILKKLGCKSNILSFPPSLVYDDFHET